MAKRKKSSLDRLQERVDNATSNSITATERVQVESALASFRRNEEAAGRSLSAKRLREIRAELEASIRRQRGR